MKKIGALLLVSALITIMISCKKDNPYEKFEGNWEGTYSGEDHGKWNANINASGELIGSAVSDSLPGFTFGISGTVSGEGNIDAYVDLFVGGLEFSGKLNNDKASGTWINEEEDIQGTWEGKKK